MANDAATDTWMACRVVCRRPCSGCSSSARAASGSTVSDSGGRRARLTDALDDRPDFGRRRGGVDDRQGEAAHRGVTLVVGGGGRSAAGQGPVGPGSRPARRPPSCGVRMARASSVRRRDQFGTGVGRYSRGILRGERRRPPARGGDPFDGEFGVEQPGGQFFAGYPAVDAWRGWLCPRSGPAPSGRSR